MATVGTVGTVGTAGITTAAVGDFIRTAEVVGEVVGIVGDKMEVYPLQRMAAQRGSLWKYADEWTLLSKEQVVQHVQTASCGILSALSQVGFRPLDEHTFVKLDEEHLVLNMPVGEIEQEECDPEADFIGIHPEMRDFIVPDEEGEAFTLAPNDTAFVRETHQAVHEYNTWEPQDASARRAKDFIDNMDRRECHRESCRSNNVVRYIRPT
tara:strand:- start:13099 stop:13728 length:630 start_codon:yes stop_codon:yes gene_type:complete